MILSGFKSVSFSSIVCSKVVYCVDVHGCELVSRSVRVRYRSGSVRVSSDSLSMSVSQCSVHIGLWASKVVYCVDVPGCELLSCSVSVCYRRGSVRVSSDSVFVNAVCL